MNATEYGLVGHPLGHSLSPFIHESLLASAGLTGKYRLIDLPPDRLAENAPVLLRQMAGFNCTIPYKEAIIPYLDGLDPSAERCRSVNTVWQGRGFNTDYQAFIDNCPPMGGHRILILGAGGVSRTIAFAAMAAGAEICVMTRRIEQADAVAAAVWTANPACRIHTVSGVSEWLDTHPFDDPAGAPWGLVNGTPLGLWPNMPEMPFPAELLSHFAWVFDTIYNPPATRLVLAARSRGIPARGGLGMLFDQAVAAQRIWNPAAAFPADQLQTIRNGLSRRVISHFPLNILLTGFMGSGKSTVAAALAKRLDLPFADLDQTIVDSADQTIPEIFATSGESAFRSLERQKMGEMLAAGHSQVIATGGGALIDPVAEAMVRKYPASIVYLDTPLEEIRQRVGDGEGRPLLAGQGAERLENLFLARRSRYLSLADLRVSGTGNPEEIAAVIAAGLGYEGENT